MKKLILVFLAVGLLTAGCSSFGFSSSNIVKFQDKAGNKYYCKVTNEDKQKGFASCTINKNGIVYSCKINVEKTNKINIDEQCEIVAE